MSNHLTAAELFQWCKIPSNQLVDNPALKVPFRMVKDSSEMGKLMASELADEIKKNNARGKPTIAIIPCGPSCWYKPFTDLVNRDQVSLKELIVFHMDECLDWQGRELPKKHPYNFRETMEKLFYAPVLSRLSVPLKNRRWLNATTYQQVKEDIEGSAIDITLGGWGQDGHIAYNQARRHPYSHLSLEELRNSTVRIQENNPDTIIALAHRTFGSAYQFVPPMSVTLGVKECLSAKKIRLFSDTGAWKQTALRVALFGPPTPEYPITLCQEHPDAIITATIDTATHPISENPDWELIR
jgi:glucosamine-6-phosphate deaminase